ncbi:hypothetical protein KPL71_012327 [Citrus sinensis]|uniref:Uncharacterized protein n=1 Tax=Citrus sinensis TaxID=2711 RepID=A0ACB8LAB8_CITSI|nr:hypothetical protein KPL71_012327 [Citrus sinensis]
MFDRSRAYLCKQLIQMEQQKQQNLNNSSILLPAELIPCFDRTLIKDPNGLVFRRAPKEFRVDPKKLRDKAQRNEVLIRKAKELHLSSYVLTCAYVYVFLVKATGEEGDATVMFGHGAAVKASDVVDPENGIAYVADKLSDLVKGL